MLLLVIILILNILFLWQRFSVKKKEFFINSNSKYLIIRILGNDIPSLHSESQTLDNLRFTISNEKQFKYTDKLFILNRIIDNDKKGQIIQLLEQNNIDYIDIPVDYDRFNSLEKIDFNKINSIDDDTMKSLKSYNLCLISINNARNIGLQYGRKN